MSDLCLRELISEALRNASENDYDFKLSTLNDIALDLLTNDADIEAFTYDEVMQELVRRLLNNKE